MTILEHLHGVIGFVRTPFSLACTLQSLSQAFEPKSIWLQDPSFYANTELLFLRHSSFRKPFQVNSTQFWLLPLWVWGIFVFVMLNMFDHFIYVSHLPKFCVLCEQVSLLTPSGEPFNGLSVWLCQNQAWPRDSTHQNWYQLWSLPCSWGAVLEQRCSLFLVPWNAQHSDPVKLSSFLNLQSSLKKSRNSSSDHGRLSTICWAVSRGRLRAPLPRHRQGYRYLPNSPPSRVWTSSWHLSGLICPSPKNRSITEGLATLSSPLDRCSNRNVSVFICKEMYTCLPQLSLWADLSGKTNGLQR